MEDLSIRKKVPGSGLESNLSFESQLKNITISRLEMLSEDGKEKVLEFVNALIDSEQKKIEFQRRQGRLYRLPEQDSAEQQV